MPHQSQRHDAWDLDALPIPRDLDAGQSLGLDAWFLGFKVLGNLMPYQSLGMSMPCQSLGLDAWLLGFKVSGVLMPCQSPGLDAWFLGFKILGISMPSQSPSLDAWISMPYQSLGLDAWFLGFKISGVLMPCQSPGIANSMEEWIPDTTEKVSMKSDLSDSVDNLIDNGGLPYICMQNPLRISRYRGNLLEEVDSPVLNG
ncbi:uncharacterized protein G2W53_014478 [Senna tora]|uniref:Uncharacterized protein n=1 Tax=Senna tora TaxID=362788 RepID=A0A834WTK6_9FABA|nr:uncharacterized protein G2W53_014478 [Senna tora]